LGVGLDFSFEGSPAGFAGVHFALFATEPTSVPHGFFVALPFAFGLSAILFFSLYKNSNAMTLN
jgi:hypothetical protein